MQQRDGAWPAFIDDPVFKDSHHGPLDPQEKERRRIARLPTPEQIEARREKDRKRSLAKYYANRDNLLPQMREYAKGAYARMTPEQKKAKQLRTKAYRKAHPEKVQQYNKNYNTKKKSTYTTTTTATTYGNTSTALPGLH